MRILHIIDSLEMGGAENLVTLMAATQKEMGHSVSVVLLKAPSNNLLLKRLQNFGIGLHIISDTRSVKSILNIFSIMPYLKKCDIAHVHLFPANYWTAIAKVLSFSSTPLVTTEHSTSNKRRKIKIFKYIDNCIYKIYEEVIACSDKARETFIARYPKVHCNSIPNGINIDCYMEAEGYSKEVLANIPEDTFVTSMVSRFIPSKRQDTLVEALTLLPKKFHAVFIGGQATDIGLIKVKELAEKLNVSERVHFLYIRSDIPQILKSSDAVLLSSEYEGLSLSSIEGMASGRPFIASDVDGLREVTIGAGILVPCGDARELASELEKLSINNTYYNSVVDACLQRAKQFDIKDITHQYIVEYSKYV